MSTFVELGTSRRYKRLDGVGSGNILYISSFEEGAYRLVANYYIPPDQAISQYSTTMSSDMDQTSLLSATSAESYGGKSLPRKDHLKILPSTTPATTVAQAYCHHIGFNAGRLAFVRCLA